jgi:hypothetical protein
MRRVHALSLLALFACGSDPSGEPFLSGAVGGNFAGNRFDIRFGFVTDFEDDNLFNLGDGGQKCGSELEELPPSGNTVVFSLSSLAPGSFNGVFVEMFNNGDQFLGISSNEGTVTITSATEDSVAGSISYAHTDDENRMYSVEGEFEVTRCDPAE